jgi:hypothetical protein
MSERIQREFYRKITYSQKHWALLEKKRALALKVLEIFKTQNLSPYLYGSTARGDVHNNSDIDLAFLHRVPAFKIEFLLNQNGYRNYRREIIMATPGDAIKLYIYLSELTAITLPLTKLTKTSLEFYGFGGKIDYKGIIENERIPGIDKRLVLITPQSYGHEERSVINRENIAAKEVGVTIETIYERERVLLRREKHGRTGVFLKRELSPQETPEGVLENLARKNPIIRKKIY